MSRYVPLSPDEVRETGDRYYQRRAAKSQPQERPVFILVGGQPGAGKSAAANVVREELAQRGGYIHLDADRMREQINTINTRPTSEETQADAGQLVSALRAAAISGRRNALEEGTFRNAEAVSKFIDARRNDGYSIELVAVATARQESILGIHQRHEAQHLAGAENPRYVPVSYHDEAMLGFAKTLEQNTEKLDRVRVVNRDGKTLYDSQARDNRAANPTQALRDGHILPDERLKSIADAWQTIAALAQNRGADARYLATVMEQKATVQAEMQSRMNTHAIAALGTNIQALKADGRFSGHAPTELASAAYYRGVVEKSADFKGEAPNLAAFDTKMADRATVRQLPDVPELAKQEAGQHIEQGRAANRSDDGLSR